MAKDGSIKINKTMLSQRTSKFDESLEEDVIKDPDFEISTLTAFFDSLLSFEKVTPESALIVLPVAQKYDIQDLIEKCINQLNPTKMNENVISSLNLALDINCDELTDAVLDLLLEFGIHRLFSYEPFYFLLKPKSVYILLRYVGKSPIILRNVIKWGRNYMEKNQINGDLRTFFQKNGILKRLSIDCLESIDSVLELYDIDSRKNAFTEKELLNCLKNKMVTKESQYKWVDIKKGEEISEDFKFKKMQVVDKDTKIYISFNSCICDLLPLKEKTADNFIEINVKITSQTVSNYKYKTNSYSMNLIEPVECCQNDTFKIIPVANMSTLKYQINTSMQNKFFSIYTPILHLKSIFITYRFHRDCKILKTVANTPKLADAESHEILYMTSDIEID